MTEQTCNDCGGTGQQEQILPECKMVPCMLSRGNAQGVWDHLAFMVAQFITCDGCNHLQDEDPLLCTCEYCPCEIERREIMSLAWHYAQAKMRELAVEEHIVEFRETTFGLQHPLSCRTSGLLLDCLVNRALEAMDFPPELGRFVVSVNGGVLEIGERR